MVTMPETAPAQKLDAETEAALTLFNEYVIADREATRRKREVSKAEKAKDQAAAEVRKIEKDGGSAEAKAAAETAYREAVAALKDVREGKKPAAKSDKPAPAEAPVEAVAAEPEPAPAEAATAEAAAPADAAEAEAAPAETDAAEPEPAPAD